MAGVQRSGSETRFVEDPASELQGEHGAGEAEKPAGQHQHHPGINTIKLILSQHNSRKIMARFLCII